jgi:predicted nucleic acid-binding protein
VVIADSSVWIEYFRATGSRANHALRELIATAADELATTEVVIMELLAGARHDAEYRTVNRVAASVRLLPVEGLHDYVAAAELFRACRRRGLTIRRMADCLIAAVAIRTGAQILHQDHDFDSLAQHSRLRLYL